ncbi:dinuclear metal center YbgI/SA1388 family protein [Thermonema lapsum]|uniref:GTP cyclohydrolase 1 type 2 homolog n=1 Tax=Thermonema lapsum TaxID=28195 RepID=A0A846MPU8_9BACT|nr:Nif3-like dinuclear metal center hexameric protein [Thermonema lapsum]NIK73402.1 dinuclear metal center YbgI/SA1388 family protein [Thermonema lapsum]
MKVSDICKIIEAFAPAAYQESYDNARLICGNPQEEVRGVLITLDCTESVVEEAIEKGCNLVIAHHPIVFKGLKSLTGANYVERVVIKAIQKGIAIYAVHTNLDNVYYGVSHSLAARLGLQNIRILQPKTHTLEKLVVFCPLSHSAQVREALHAAGAGQIGNYKNCSFRTKGLGTFQPNEQANPFIGQAGGGLEEVEEERIEVIYPAHLQTQILTAMRMAHPYEEVAYYVHRLENYNQEVGSGAIGELNEAFSPTDFLQYVKNKLPVHVIRYTQTHKSHIRRVAVCGGSGAFLIHTARRQGADAYITADVKYHEFFDAEGEMMILDIGHYESEVHTKELIHAYLSSKIRNIALCISEISTNPINYF